MRVLLIEDDLMIGNAVSTALRDAAYGVDWVKDGAIAHSYLSDPVFDAVLLDLGLPHEDGIAILRRIRARGDHVPVLIMSARDSIEARIEGLDEGADDYLVKPFNAGELLARLRALIRRRARDGISTLSNGSLTLNPSTKQVTLNGQMHPLTRREFSLLHALLMQPGAVLSKSQLEQRIYGWAEEIDSNVVEVLIHSLRKKLGTSAIRNVRGLGWMVDRES